MKTQLLIVIILALMAVAITIIEFLPQNIVQSQSAMPQKPAPMMDSLKTQAAEKQLPELIDVLPPPELFTNNDSLLQTPRNLSPYRIEVTKSSFQLLLFRDDMQIQRYDLALGNKGADKLESSDPITPLGNFYIVSIENTSHRQPEDGDWFIRLHTGHSDTVSGKAFSGIGIKGGALLQDLGKSQETDCIIMQNKDINELKGIIENDYKLLRLPVIIRP